MRIRARDVADHVAAKHRLTFADLVCSRRDRRFARPRQVAMYAIRKLCPHMSFPAIGTMLGGRDHTTIIHGVRQIGRLVVIDREVAATVESILSEFKAREEDAGPLGQAIQFQALCAGYRNAMRLAA